MIVDRVEQTIARHALLTPGETVVVGVSGGPDSLVLLHVLHALNRWPLHVATLDHGMRGEAGAADAEFVRRSAAEAGLPVTVGRADVLAMARAQKLNPEEAARQVRYVFLLRVARHMGAAKIAVGHNRDDQAETVLMHLIRGSGLDGLRGMLPAVPLSALLLPSDVPILYEPALHGEPVAPDSWPVLVRPLLDTARAEIESYAAAHGLEPRQDATNDDLTYFRNRVRHTVIPLLEPLNPNIRETLARTADALREDAALVRQAGESALQRVMRESGADVVTLDREDWHVLSEAEKRYVIRAAVARLRPDLRNLGFEHVASAISIVDEGRTGARATLPGGLLLRVSYETFSVSEEDTSPEIDAPALDSGAGGQTFRPYDRVTQGFGTWVFEAGALKPGDDLAAVRNDPLAAALVVQEGASLELRARRPGDRFLPRGMGGHSQKLSDTLINMRVPVAWRDRVPLLAVDDVLAWFVAPTAEGMRGRVAEPFAMAVVGGVVLLVRWRKAGDR